MDRDAIGPVLALLGVAALLGAFLLYPHAGQTGGYHSVERVDAAEVPDEESVLDYGELSPEARDAFRRAVEAPDGDAVVWGASNLPSEFRYSDEESTYYVRYEGVLYLLVTGAAGSGPLGVVQLAVKGLLGVVGVGLLGAAGYRFRR
ncbi:MAG: hypothetical protein V5A85_11400 [Haloarculaceae archaeon]